MPDTDQKTDERPLPVNEDKTHVATKAPSGVPWMCPVGYLDHALSIGYTVDYGSAYMPPEPFNPDDHDVAGVNKHLADAHARGDDGEVERVLTAEAAGKARTTITDPTGSPAGDNA